jgi:hypothetical protein
MEVYNLQNIPAGSLQSLKEKEIFDKNFEHLSKLSPQSRTLAWEGITKLSLDDIS